MSENNNASRINVLIALDKASYDGKMHGGGRSFFNIVSTIDRERFNIIACLLREEDSLKFKLLPSTEFRVLTLLPTIHTLAKKRSLTLLKLNIKHILAMV